MATYRNHSLPAELEKCTFQNRVGEKITYCKETSVTDKAVRFLCIFVFQKSQDHASKKNLTQ